MTFLFKLRMISQDRSQGQSSNLCFSCFLASALLGKSQAGCLVGKCRAASEINPAALRRGCGRNPGVSCCSPPLLPEVSDPSWLPETAGADSACVQHDTDVTHGFPVLCICLLYLLQTKRVLSAEWKLQIPADRRRLEGSGGKGIPGRLQSRVGIWRCGACSLCVPVCPAM